MSSSLAWAMQQILDQPRLKNETVSWGKGVGQTKKPSGVRSPSKYIVMYLHLHACFTNRTTGEHLSSFLKDFLKSYFLF